MNLFEIYSARSSHRRTLKALGPDRRRRCCLRQRARGDPRRASWCEPSQRDPAHGDLATNAAMVLAKDARHQSARPRRAARRRAAGRPADITKAEIGGPGLHQPHARSRGVLHRGADARRRGRRTGSWPWRARSAGAPGQCGICLGQPDGADACRPLAAARCSAMRLPNLLDFAGYDGHPRILHQRRRRAGRRARPLGLSCATARRWARRSARFRRGSIRATISSRSASGWRRRNGRALLGQAGSRVAAARARGCHRRHDGR